VIAWLLDALSWACLLGGGAFAVVSGIGMLRFSDFYTRLHAAAVLDTLGAGLILLGLVLQSDWNLVTVKLFLVLSFLVLTGPTATHALAKAARHGGLCPRLGPTPE
jgi:multicomponent Na+:H+ antiporter subunit G